MVTRKNWTRLATILVLTFSAGCSTQKDSTGEQSTDSEPVDSESALDTASAGIEFTDDDSSSDGDSDTDGDSDSDVDSDSGQNWDSAPVCESAAATAEVIPAYLAFAFDVSGSMGQLDKDWHDPELKWDPVVAATTEFLGSTAAEGFFASMTFFPSHRTDRCEADSYMEADVPFTPLPSNAFEEALTAIREEDWMGGTPTEFVLEGLRASIVAQREVQPGNYAIVLVTDGYPQGCDGSDISDVVQVALAASDEGIKTYVIGVNNPPIDGAPDTLDNLHLIADAGASGSAFIIETGQASQTSADFLAAVENIRSSAFSCDVEIPAPPAGRTFNRENVRATVVVDGEALSLSYDPDCASENAWHYDDVDSPAMLSLCPDSCNVMKTASNADLSVEFTCEPVIQVE